MSDEPYPVEPTQSAPEAPLAETFREKAFPAWFPPLFYLVIAIGFLWHSTFTGEVFLPAKMLGHVAPYASTVVEELPPWNPLRWDGIAQFYPWRSFYAQTLHEGRIPLWNPYAFSGTPFVANSQSAVFYPLNLLFAILPVARAFGVNAILHLALCGWFTYLLLRRLSCRELPALLGGVVFAFSAWQVAWLQLPTFLATSCWIPLLLRQTHFLLRPRLDTSLKQSLAGGVGLGSIVGLSLLAGHLQIAFYGLLTGILWAIALLIANLRRREFHHAKQGFSLCLLSLLFGGMLASPQILPSLELSRLSHRAGKPTAQGYQAYTEYALPRAALATLTLPDLFGTDYTPTNSYWGFYFKQLPDGTLLAIRHNAAETANFVGVTTLFLGGFALLRALQRGKRNATILFFGLLALLSLLMALGTPINALFYFGVPGFGQSGSPARVLGLWALASGILAGFGLEALCRKPPTWRETATVCGAVFFLFGGGLLLCAEHVSNRFPGATYPEFGEVLGRIGIGWGRFALGILGGIALLSPLAAKPLKKKAFAYNAPLALLLTVIELFWAGIFTNPTAKPQEVYPVTPAIALLQQQTGHERIFPVNKLWSLYESPPAVLPPNAGMVYGLRDVQGYDSLFMGQYKAFANQFARPNRAGVSDASPEEVGNMVFFQNPNAPLTPNTAAKFALTLSPADKGFVPDAAPKTETAYNMPKEMAIYPLKGAKPRANIAGGSTEWLEDSATRLRLRVSTPSTGTLSLADTFSVGWLATLDGRPLVINRDPETHIYRTVEVPAGTHDIVFLYAPATFRVGLYFACFALGLGAMIFALRRKLE